MALSRSPVLTRAVVALTVVGTLLFAGCGGGGSSSTGSDAKARKGGSITVAQTSEVITLDPITAVDGPSITVLSQIMEPLYRTTADDKVVPWLVTKAKKSADGLTWTFRLRPGVKFSNGQPLTSADVAFSLNTVRKSANGEALFESVSSVTAPSPSTVVVKTKEPTAALLANLSSYNAVIVPKDFGGVSQKQFGQHPIGSGPFQLGQWKRGQSLQLERNPNYWGEDRPLLDEVVVRGVPNDNSRLSQLRGDAVDVIASPAFSQVEGLERTPGIVVGQYALGRADYINLNSKSELFASPLVREAVNLGVDRQAIVEAAINGYGKVGGAWLPPAVLYSDTDLQAPARDIAKAKRLLAEAIKKEGVDPTFTLLAIAGETYPTTASQIIQQDLEEIGFDVTLQPLDESSVIAQLSAGDYDACLIWLYPSIIDPSNLVGFYLATGSFFTGADSNAIEKLAAEGQADLGDAERRGIYYEIQEVVAAQEYLLTLDYQPYVWAMRDTVVGFESNAVNTPWFADVGLSG